MDMDTLVDATYDYVMPRTPFGVAIAAECCVIATDINTRVERLDALKERNDP